MLHGHNNHVYCYLYMQVTLLVRNLWDGLSDEANIADKPSGTLQWIQMYIGTKVMSTSLWIAKHNCFSWYLMTGATL